MKLTSTFVAATVITCINGFVLPRQPKITTSTMASNDEETVLYSDAGEGKSKNFSKDKRWASLNPTVKARIVKEGQERAIRNKKKREPAANKKRRMLMHYKKAMIENKKISRVTRPLAPNSDQRMKLKDIVIGETYNGTVISLTDFGAYVDVGTECDGLLHVSQITRSEFVEHPRQFFSPGDIVDVRVTRVNPGLKRMQLTMLPEHILEEEDEEEEDFEERISLEELAIDDELWGEIKRVTSYGAYVELGAIEQGWLHFMDHPEFEYGSKPRDFMKVGDRIRCWVSNIEVDMQRIKITANRPNNLPGPKREIQRLFDEEY